MNYMQYLNEQIIKNTYTSSAKYLPAFLQVLTGLLNEELLDDDRHMITAAIAYVVAPDDVLSEDTYGEWGYMDDVYVCCMILKKLTAYQKAIDHYWVESFSSLESFNSVLILSYAQSTRFLEEKGLLHKTLEYAGLDS